LSGTPPANGAPSALVWHAAQSAARARYRPRAIVSGDALAAGAATAGDTGVEAVEGVDAAAGAGADAAEDAADAFGASAAIALVTSEGIIDVFGLGGCAGPGGLGTFESLHAATSNTAVSHAARAPQRVTRFRLMAYPLISRLILHP
jgi:hypothetical protein